LIRKVYKRRNKTQNAYRQNRQHIGFGLGLGIHCIGDKLGYNALPGGKPDAFTQKYAGWKLLYESNL
jgi:hypothetical protein